MPEPRRRTHRADCAVHNLESCDCDRSGPRATSGNEFRQAVLLLAAFIVLLIFVNVLTRLLPSL